MARVVTGTPSFLPLLIFKDLDKALEEFVGLGNLAGGVGVYGEASAYALVWELGSRRLKRPGPKTIWGRNRNKERVILTKQAPRGYVTPTKEFWPIIEKELDRINFARIKDKREMVLTIESALDNASHKIARIIAQRAPVDSGALRSEIMGVDADETDFLNDDSSDLESEGTFIL